MRALPVVNTERATRLPLPAGGMRFRGACDSQRARPSLQGSTCAAIGLLANGFRFPPPTKSPIQRRRVEPRACGSPDMLLIWIGFITFILALLALDLGVFNRKAHVVGVKEALG